MSTGAYGTDQVWHCPCGAYGPRSCTCQDRPLREALYGRLEARGVTPGPGVRALATKRLAALLVVLEDPFWSESDSVLEQDAEYMILLIKEGEGRER